MYEGFSGSNIKFIIIYKKMYFSNNCSVYCKEEPPRYKYDKRA